MLLISVKGIKVGSRKPEKIIKTMMGHRENISRLSQKKSWLSEI